MSWLYSYYLAVPLIEGEEHRMVSTRLLATAECFRRAFSNGVLLQREAAVIFTAVTFTAVTFTARNR